MFKTAFSLGNFLLFFFGLEVTLSSFLGAAAFFSTTGTAAARFLKAWWPFSSSGSISIVPTASLTPPPRYLGCGDHAHIIGAKPSAPTRGKICLSACVCNLMYSHKDITGTAGYVAIATIIARPQYSMNALVNLLAGATGN